ncbi:MAG: hypothetical protein CMM52_15535 [Rhodospirillaceae bacterium]|nr:hypothetical protein [Rhodospirillaceae bacterium]
MIEDREQGNSFGDRGSIEDPSADLDSETLLGGAREVTIRHKDSLYRLRATRKGKLILTK